MSHYVAAGAASSAGSLLLSFTLLSLAVLAYWAPTFVALGRHVPGKGQIIVVNFLLGWTVIGWIVALVMAFRAVPPQPASTPPQVS